MSNFEGETYRLPEPISAPPMESEQSEQSEQSEDVEVTVLATSNSSDGYLSTRYQIEGDPAALYGRVSIVVGTRSSEQAIIDGALLPFYQFCALRDILLSVLKIPPNMRVGYFEFPAARDSEDSNCYELMFLSEENLLGIAVGVCNSEGDDVPVLVSLS